MMLILSDEELPSFERTPARLAPGGNGQYHNPDPRVAKLWLLPPEYTIVHVHAHEEPARERAQRTYDGGLCVHN